MWEHLCLLLIPFAKFHTCNKAWLLVLYLGTIFSTCTYKEKVVFSPILTKIIQVHHRHDLKP